ncbi:carbamoyl-phosphate synthase large subunit [Spirochaetota bacterium]|nr:carbamoyl-phosphate synthase large subunit [Spirochaetota bacterium]
MPKRTDIKTILVIGSGPIVIGQACEFDYSGTQACKVLREDGYRVILINSNPATIMTDSETADEVYIEAINTETIEKILIKENIDAILPTVGGQTALNVSLSLKENGILDKYNVSLIGADEEAIRKAENRELFEAAMHELGYKTTPAYHVKNMREARHALSHLDLPLVIRPSFTLGGSGGAIATTKEDYLELVANGLRLSRISEVVVEQSIIGWKEFELEVMKDHADNTVIICSIENIDPIGIHTGDSMTVAPQQTLSDREYQTLRNMTIRIIQKIGVATGGANVQFAINSHTGEIIVIEMNPRVSRSSALASKATGFPIAKIAAKLAVGYTLDEIENDITRSTPACFEPSIDYVVVKLPRFAFEKFARAVPYLGVQMKSVGEAMAIGRTFTEAFQKAIRSLEVDLAGFDGDLFSYQNINDFTEPQLHAYIQKHTHQIPKIKHQIRNFYHKRLCCIKDLFYLGVSEAEITETSLIDPWFIHQFATLFSIEQRCRKYSLNDLLEKSLTHPYSIPNTINIDELLPSPHNDSSPTISSLPISSSPASSLANDLPKSPSILQQIKQSDPTKPIFSIIKEESFLKTLKKHGFSDLQLAYLFRTSETTVRHIRYQLGIRPVFKIVDTCAGEFEARTPYYYSSYDEEDELQYRLHPTDHTHHHSSNPNDHDNSNISTLASNSNNHDNSSISTLASNPNDHDNSSISTPASNFNDHDNSSISSNSKHIDTSRTIEAGIETGNNDSKDKKLLPQQNLNPNQSPLSHKKRKRIVIIGGGPNRIGQGIEFDYMCVQASLELRKLGYDPVMINSNPETVSTDYDVSSFLFFDPLTAEDVLEIIAAVGAIGVIVHFGGQTSLNLSAALNDTQIPILGTQHHSIVMSEDRKAFSKILKKINALQPPNDAVFTYKEVLAAAQKIGYPVLIRPSFVLGGRAMKIAHNEPELKEFFNLAKNAAPPLSILIDKYLENARELDIDLLSDGNNTVICGILEHVEAAGIHSGDSACFIPPKSISKTLIAKMIVQAKALAVELKIVGLMNIQFALYQDNIYFLEANPRGSRTIPFVSKATGIPWVRIAVQIIMGRPISEQELALDFNPETMDYVAVKEAILPFNKFPDEDPLLGPEMKSTGEVMGIGENLYEAFYKTQLSTQSPLPPPPCGILISVHKKTPELIEACQTLTELGYSLYATIGTQKFINHHNLPATLVHKLTTHHHAITENDIVARIINGQIKLVFNTPSGTEAEISDAYIRLVAQKYGIGVFTTLDAIYCVTKALKEFYARGRDFSIYSVRTIAKRHLNSRKKILSQP